jgi:siderophore synthetase component
VNTTGAVLGRLADAAAHADAGLTEHAPHLVAGYRAALPAAADTVGRRLRGALVREDIGDARARDAGHGRQHGFDRVDFDHAGADDPVDLLPAGLPATGWGFAAELSNAVVNLAIATARQAHTRPPRHADGDPDDIAVAAERLAVAGHNLHPCGRTRLGWDVPDVLAHDMEAGTTRIGFVAVRHDLHVGDELGADLAAAYPQLPAAPPGYRLQPAHVWQRDAVIARRYPGLLADGALRILDPELDAAPTAALRTLLLPPGADGARRYLKVSLDILITSTRRSISVASAHNGPIVSALLRRLIDADPDGGRLLLLAETAGAAVPAGAGRDLSAILRCGLTGALAGGPAGEHAVPGGALPAVDPATGRTVVAGLVTAYAHTRGRPDDAAAARAFLDEYARLLLPPLLRLAAHGVALEAHLQNCLPTFVAGVPTRLAVRDFAGLRLHPARLAAHGWSTALWPGSVIATDDVDILRAKIGYTALQAHLGELVIRLAGSHGLDEDAAWRTVRAVVDDTYEPLRAGPATQAAAAADHAALTAAYVPHKALVRMRLGGAGDTYLPVRNPLHVG